MDLSICNVGRRQPNSPQLGCFGDRMMADSRRLCGGTRKQGQLAPEGRYGTGLKPGQSLPLSGRYS